MLPLTNAQLCTFLTINQAGEARCKKRKDQGPVDACPRPFQKPKTAQSWKRNDAAEFNPYLDVSPCSSFDDLYTSKDTAEI